MIRRPPRSTRVRSSAASDVYKRQDKGERAKKSANASSKRKAVREIKKKKLNKIYRELRKARKK